MIFQFAVDRHGIYGMCLNIEMASHTCIGGDEYSAKAAANEL